jgi:hypothetical protein
MGLSGCKQAGCWGVFDRPAGVFYMAYWIVPLGLASAEGTSILVT